MYRSSYLRDLVLQDQAVTLYHYHSITHRQRKTPVLIVFATINRPDILDLQQQTSFIGDLLRQGMDVYLLDWGGSSEHPFSLRLNNQIALLSKCVQFILNSLRIKKINLLGVCQGGVISLCYAALHEAIKNLILISTPVDFHANDFLLARLAEKITLKEVKKIPGAWLAQFFVMLNPFSFQRKYLHFYDHQADAAWMDKFWRIEKWRTDMPDQSAATLKQFMQDFFQKNKLN